MQTLKGYLRDPKYDDFPMFDRAYDAFASLARTTGGDHDVPDLVPIFDQGALGSCVLNATVGQIEILLSNENETPTMLSRLFLYWLCRKAMNTVGEDSGTYPHLAVERAQKVGVCEERVWTYADDPDSFKAPPPGALEAVMEASDNRPAAYYRIDSSDPASKLAQLEAAIRADHPVIFGTPVDRKIQDYRKGQVLGPPDPNAIIGGHSMLFVGVRNVGGERVWRVRNSWGAEYGDAGHLLMNDAWVSADVLDDLWVLTRMDALVF